MSGAAKRKKGGRRIVTDRAHRHRVLGRYISQTGGALFIVGFLYLLYLAVGFTSAPTAPVAFTGQVVPWSDHGTFHYITIEQHNRLMGTILFCGGAFLCTAIGIYLKRLPDK